MNILVNIFRLTVILLVLSPLCILPAKAEEGKLSVGAARVDVTPAVNPQYSPSGNYDHEQLYVRAIVMDNTLTKGALITADIADITTGLWNDAAPKVAQLLNCPVENIVMSATHSHSACPAGPPPPRFNDIDEVKMSASIVEAVKQAKAKMQPAKVAFGKGEAHLNVNRDAISPTTRLWTQGTNLDGSSDKTLAVVVFATPDNRPIAGYMNYAMHPNNGYLSGITTADFPGAACRYVEKAFGDDMVMAFSQGASGDQNPRWVRPAVNVLLSKSGSPITGFDREREPIEYPLRKGVIPHGKLDPAVGDVLERYIDALGIILGEETIRVMSYLEDWQESVSIWGTQEVISLPGRKRVSDAGREGVPSTYADSEPIKLRLGLLGVGNIAFSTIDAEIYSKFGIELKQQSPLTNTLFVTLANGRTNSGYIVTDSDYGKYTFQVLGNRLQPGHAEKGIVGTLVKQINQYLIQK
ncbi:MAG: neutral/alkaline non-lysosomal ceramidase N-terminal domain-containing protein [Bacteroides sp.]|nr:neutral/alkaline non-lysosomal ceramidase N-terminal domain-containing protein [Bacteroides sp.]